MPNPTKQQQSAVPPAEQLGVFSKKELTVLSRALERRADVQQEIDELEKAKDQYSDEIRAVLAQHPEDKVKSFRLGGYNASYVTSWRVNQTAFREGLLKRKVPLKTIEAALEEANKPDSIPTLRITRSKNGDGGSE